MDTKMDESVRKSWQLQPDQLEFRNPSWQAGMEKLTETIATRLGYKGVPLNCVLCKLLVYGEGGHFLKHQDTEKEDGMIATLVVQPPSTHEGGDLIVYRSGEVEHRHDFGKANGTAAYFPQYAVHYSDAEHALEKVTKGYRLALVYSICLPVSLCHLKRDPNLTMSDELANVINSMGPEDESFALLLTHEYTKKSIEDLGSGALKGVDSARFRVLEEANYLVPADKKLRFFIAKLAVQDRQFNYYEKRGDSDMELLLLVAGGVDDGIAKQALITAAMTKEAYDLSSLDAVEILWDVCRSGDKQTFDMVFTHYMSDYGKTSEQFVVLKTIAGKRTEWLKEEIEKLDKIDKDFSWECPTPMIRNTQRLKSFCEIQEFAGLREAKEYAKRCLNEGQYESSYTTEAGEDNDPFVTITKTRKWFEDSQVKLAQYKAELAV
ncbi:Oxoglutarate/iron-dependent dioxygenase [Phytophthora cactorum]|nr:Oxoglutarate/iron-dependent dioxygenase [Phytophthora cactorum]